MAPDIREQLRRAVRDPRADLDLAALRQRVRQLRRRRLGLAVAAVALVALLVPLGQAGLERLGEPAEVLDRPAPSPTTTTRPVVPAATPRTPAESLRALSQLPPGWSDLPPPPGPRARAVSLWTGSHLFLWGGDSGNAGTHHSDGWLFDPVARRWHAVSPSPLAGRSLAAAVWTGDEVIVWGGSARGASTFNDGAAYDPATNTWRLLPTAPLSGRAPVTTVWTGTEMILWGSTSRASDVRDGAAFNPRTDRWRTIAPAPLALNQAGWPSPNSVWTGQEMVVVGSRLDNNNASTSPYATGLAYNPAIDAWRRLPRIRLSPQASTAVWTGSRVLAWDYELRAAAYDPKQDAWRRLPRVPIGACEAAPDGAAADRMVLAQGCGHALWDSRAGMWRKAEPKKNRSYGHGRVVAAGPVFLIAGATHESDANALVAYSPR